MLSTLHFISRLFMYIVTGEEFSKIIEKNREVDIINTKIFTFDLSKIRKTPLFTPTYFTNQLPTYLPDFFSNIKGLV